MPSLSIIIPIYNIERYLEKCLDSVIYPEISDYEIIAVNDGSTDSSYLIACKYAEKYPELIRLIDKENGGLSSARNAGISASRGEYLQFLDSDDYLSENAVPEMLEAVKEGFDIGIFDFVSVDNGGRVLAFKKGCEREGVFTLEQYPQLIMAPPNACNKLWRKSLFTENGISFPEGLWFEDLATSPRLYIKARKIVSIQKTWYNYLFRAGSITNNSNTIRNLEMLQVCDIIFDYYRQAALFDRYKNELEYMAAYHELITSTTRVNLSDRKSPVQKKFLEYFLQNFPDYKSNPYIQSMPSKYKLLLKLITGGHLSSVHCIMSLNNMLRK